MATIEELLSEYDAAQAFSKIMIEGGENTLDINNPPSQLLPETVQFVSTKLAWERQLSMLLSDATSKLLMAQTAIKALADFGYPARKVFQVTPEVAADLAGKQAGIKSFNDEFDVPELLADKLDIVERV